MDRNSCFVNMYESSPLESTANGSENHSTFLLYNLSILKVKVQQLQSFATTIYDQSRPLAGSESTVIHMDMIGGLLQEIITTASSMMFTCQNVALGAAPGDTQDNAFLEKSEFNKFQSNTFDWNNCNSQTFNSINNNSNERQQIKTDVPAASRKYKERLSPRNYAIVDVEAADLLAKYTHYCQVCGKGFKRDANLRMHMRAHGDEFKSVAALSNPDKTQSTEPNGWTGSTTARKYSCPQEGCRWNRKHVRFQPLKSMVCAKNHYKRSHCPKMYVCKRCNQKQFSVLSDLRTHEKHCGDVKWRCSCGTTFSRKDKLMGHVGLFIGHTPIVVTRNDGSLVINGVGKGFDFDTFGS